MTPQSPQEARGPVARAPQEQTSLHCIVLLALLVIAAAVFIAGVNWGLPSRAVDLFLFGDQPVWSGEKILGLAGGWSENRSRGADVDVNPLGARDEPVWLNETDAQRAEIIRRYRLFSYQPDEMITFRALAQMKPGQLDLDPRFYQYGGLWIYPVGGLLRLAGAMGAVHLTADLTYYLEHPEAFGRFYIVARLYSVLWGLVGLCAVYWIARRMSGSVLVAATSGLCYSFMPVVINMAHEAKPHLPGTVLMLLAVIAAMKFVETDATRWWLASGVACGAAFGMVLSSLPIFIVLPMMVLLRPAPWARRFRIAALAGVVGLGTYFLANPYVAINWFTNRKVLISNLTNSTAMYQAGQWRDGAINAGRLIAEGTSWPLAVIGVLAACAFLVREALRAKVESRRAAWLMFVPAALICLQFTALAAGKPGEYGRFALFPDICLAIAAAVVIGSAIKASVGRTIVFALLIGTTAFHGWRYLGGFMRDSTPQTSRMIAAQQLQDLSTTRRTMGIYAEPAPYSLPPVHLFNWRLILLPSSDGSVAAHVMVRVAGATPGPHNMDDPAPISWADERFEVRVNRTTVSLEQR